MNRSTRIVVIGASAGGHSGIKTFVKDIPKDINATFVVVQHTSADANLFYADLLQKHTPLKVQYAKQGEMLKKGHIYLSVPDLHVLVDKERIILTSGPTENLVRPSVDPLFRNAAANFGNRSIGIILSGMLNDGTSGLMAIKEVNGYTMVQNPKSAEYPEMPNSAMSVVRPDRCCRIEEMADELMDVMNSPLKEQIDIPEYIEMEAAISRTMGSEIGIENKIGDQVPYGCPECGGPLWEMKAKGPLRFRCHTGHGYTSETLIKGQNSKIEESLWIALRTLEERINILRKSRERNSVFGQSDLVQRSERKIKETQRSINHLREAMNISPPSQEDISNYDFEIQECDE